MSDQHDEANSAVTGSQSVANGDGQVAGPSSAQSMESSTSRGGPANSQKAKPPRYRASISRTRLPDELVAKVRELEEILDRPVLLMIEGQNDDDLVMFPPFFSALARSKKKLPEKKIAVLLHSFGGIGSVAYRIATLLRRRCGGYSVVIPRIAKSAATLFSLGAEQIILSEDGELGPLDAQFKDHDVEEDWVSALDTVQAVEQLEDSAIEVAIKMLRYLNEKTRKKYNVLLEHALHFAAEITQPLFNKIDAVRYSRQHRTLKEAQDYAERLLQPQFSSEEAKAIARDLVRRYSTHHFVINREEAMQIGTIYGKEEEDERRDVGLQIMEPHPNGLDDLLEWFSLNIHKTGCTGFIEEENP